TCCFMITIPFRHKTEWNRILLFLLSLCFFVSSGQSLSAAEWKAGVARVSIVPGNPIWLTGFAARTNVSRGILHDLQVRALALEDSTGTRAVLITSDLLGFPAEVSENIARMVRERYGLSRDRLLFNASHTHGAPAVASPAQFIYGPKTTPEQRKVIEDYTRELEYTVVAIIGVALKRLEPAELHYAEGRTTFGVN